MTGFGRVKRQVKKILKSVPEDEKVYFDPFSVYHGHHKVTYRGIKAIRCPFDYVIYQMIVHEVQPDLIIEIGTKEGGGALYLADLLSHLGGKREVHAIDVNSEAEDNVKSNPAIRLFTNGWEDYDLDLTKGFNNILVIEDAAHTYECSIGAMEKFASVVSPGSYLIVEDGIVNELDMEAMYQGGPLRAIREFLPRHEEFMVDQSWCNLFGKNATFNVNGYLKKIK